MLLEENPVLNESNPNKKNKNNNIANTKSPKFMDLFPPTASWKIQKPNSEDVVEPENPYFKNERAPTVPE